MHSRQPAHFPAPNFRVHSLSNFKRRKDNYLPFRLSNLRPLLCFCIPSASIIRCIYPLVCTFCFAYVVTAPSDSFLSSFSVVYSIYIPIAPNYDFLHHIALCFISVFLELLLFNTSADWTFLFTHSSVFLLSRLIIAFLSLSGKSTGYLLVYF